MEALGRTLVRIAGALALVGLWQGVVALGWVNPTILSPPADVLRRVVLDLGSAGFWEDAASTAFRWSVGYISGVVIGVPLGLFLGLNRLAYTAAEFSIEFLRALPVTAMFPVFLLLFGIGDASKIAMVFAATVFIVLLNSAYGVINAPLERRKMAKAFGANARQTLTRVVVWDAAPQISVGMRTTLSLSLIVVIVSEMFIGTQHGLGERVFTAYQTNQSVSLYATVVVLGLLGYVINATYVVIERRALFWTGR